DERPQGHAAISAPFASARTVETNASSTVTRTRSVRRIEKPRAESRSARRRSPFTPARNATRSTCPGRTFEGARSGPRTRAPRHLAGLVRAIGTCGALVLHAPDALYTVRVGEVAIQERAVRAVRDGEKAGASCVDGRRPDPGPRDPNGSGPLRHRLREDGQAGRIGIHVLTVDVHPPLRRLERSTGVAVRAYGGAHGVEQRRRLFDGRHVPAIGADPLVGCADEGETLLGFARLRQRHHRVPRVERASAVAPLGFSEGAPLEDSPFWRARYWLGRELAVVQRRPHPRLGADGDGPVRLAVTRVHEAGAAHVRLRAPRALVVREPRPKRPGLRLRALIAFRLGPTEASDGPQCGQQAEEGAAAGNEGSQHGRDDDATRKNRVTSRKSMPP